MDLWWQKKKKKKIALNMPANLENSVWPQDWKRSVFIPILKKDNTKECSNYQTIALILHDSKVMLKIVWTRCQQYLNQELPDIPMEFRKWRETRDQIASIHWITEKARTFQKNSTSASLTVLKPLTVWITTGCGKFLKRWEYQTTYLHPEKSVWKSKAMVRTGHATMNWLQIGKGVGHI